MPTYDLVVATEDVSVADGQLISAVGAAVTATLPANDAGQALVVLNSGGGSVYVAGGTFYGPGLAGEMMLPLLMPNAHIHLADDGSVWRVVSGAMDTGWVQIITPSGVSTSLYCRQLGDRVYFKGSMATGTSTIAAGTELFTLPAALAPIPDGLKVFAAYTYDGGSAYAETMLMASGRSYYNVDDIAAGLYVYADCEYSSV